MDSIGKARGDDCELSPVFKGDTDHDSTYEELKAKQDAENMMRFVSGTGSRLENSIYNSIEVRWLMDLEKQGLGHISVTEYLNTLQDQYRNGQSRMFPDLDGRRKPVEPNRMERLIQELATYRSILQSLKRQFSKKRKGSEMRTYAEVIQHFIDRIDRGEKIIDFDEK